MWGEQLAKIKWLLDKATKRPWTIGVLNPKEDQTGPRYLEDSRGDMVLNVCDCGFDSDNPNVDANLIVESVNNIEALLKAIQDLHDDKEALAQRLLQGDSSRCTEGHQWGPGMLAVCRKCGEIAVR